MSVTPKRHTHNACKYFFYAKHFRREHFLEINGHLGLITQLFEQACIPLILLAGTAVASG